MASKKITVLSLGFRNSEEMTLKTYNKLFYSTSLYLRTSQHPITDILKQKKINFQTLDSFYNEYEDFDEMHSSMACYLWEQADSDTVFAVIDATTDISVQQLVKKKPKDGILDIFPSVSAVDYYFSCFPSIPMTEGICVFPATALNKIHYSPESPVLITEIDSEILAGQVKLWLLDQYNDDTQIVIFPSSIQQKCKPRFIQPQDLDRQGKYDHSVAVFLPVIPLLKRQHFSIYDLLMITNHLRGRNGCPWDQKQTHVSLKPHLIEEAWQVSGAIDEGDPFHLSEELGDLLFQIIFHCSIGNTYDELTLQQVIDGICLKMIRRHSHIFNHNQVTSEEQAITLWEERKNRENGSHSPGEAMSNVSGNLPALKYAAKVLKKADLLNLNHPLQLPDVISQEARALINFVHQCTEKEIDCQTLLHDSIRQYIDSVLQLQAKEKTERNNFT